MTCISIARYNTKESSALEEKLDSYGYLEFWNGGPFAVMNKMETAFAYFAVEWILRDKVFICTLSLWMSSYLKNLSGIRLKF